MVDGIHTLTQADTVLLTENSQAKAAKSKDIADEDMVCKKNADDELMHLFHPESTARLGFLEEFLRVGVTSPHGFFAVVEKLAHRYAEMRAELLERYSDNPDELYKQLGKLNHAFEDVLHRTQFSPLSQTSDTHAASNDLDNFFEIFLKSIQKNSFDIAFAESVVSLRLQNFVSGEESKRVYNIRGGKLIITTCENGIQRAEIIRGGVYGKTNAELGRVTEHNEIEDLETLAKINAPTSHSAALAQTK